jgi:hypothetical protein
MRCAVLLLAPLAVASAAVASAYSATVNKCVDAAGHVTFTQTACPPRTVVQTVLEVENRPPSGDGPAVPLAVPHAETQSQPLGPSAQPGATAVAPPVPVEQPSASEPEESYPEEWNQGYGYPIHRRRPYPPYYPPAPPRPSKPETEHPSGKGIRLGADHSTGVHLQPQAQHRHGYQPDDERH